MGIYSKINDLKHLAFNTPGVNMAGTGDITLYDNRATIRYPYINLDVVTALVQGGITKYQIRVYVCDRNEPYVAYNKCETILNQFLINRAFEISNYTINYFTLNFKDSVNGVWADIVLETPLSIPCLDGGDLNGETGFILNEWGDLIRIENESGYIKQEETNINNAL